MHDVALNVSGQNWYGWKEVRIQRAITQIANEFTLGLTDRWSDETVARPIKEGAACSVSIDGQTVITGYVDEATTSYDEQSHGIEVQGRDITGDLVDCSAPSFQWAGRDLLRGAQELCKPFGISVRATSNVSKAFRRMKSDEGETVFDVIESAARIRGVLLMSDGQGGLVIGRAGQKRLSGQLELGVNIKQGSGRRSLRDRFSQYTVKGQAGAESAFTESSTSVSHTVNDAGVSRYRPKVILAEDGLDIAGCKDRAVWHRNVAAAKSQTVNYTIHSWYLNGQLLEPNVLVPVKDHYLNIQRDLLIVAVAYIVDDKGLRAELSLALPEAYALQELPEPGDEGGLW